MWYFGSSHFDVHARQERGDLERREAARSPLRWLFAGCRSCRWLLRAGRDQCIPHRIAPFRIFNPLKFQTDPLVAIRRVVRREEKATLVLLLEPISCQQPNSSSEATKETCYARHFISCSNAPASLFPCVPPSTTDTAHPRHCQRLVLCGPTNYCFRHSDASLSRHSVTVTLCIV